MDVVKVGGSLERCTGFGELCRRLEVALCGARALVVPGGGCFADAVRAADERRQLRPESAHWMAVLAMDQYGYLLADRMPGAVCVRTGDEMERAFNDGRVPVLLPFRLLRREDPLPPSWAVTSDAIALWVARHLAADRCILLKDRLPQGDPAGATVEAMARLGWVDPTVPVPARGYPGEIWLCNGRDPRALSGISAGRPDGLRLQ